MIFKLLLLIIFNLIYTLNNYVGVFNLIIVNIILFFVEFFIVRIKISFKLKKFFLPCLFALLLISLNEDIYIFGYKNLDVCIKKVSDDSVKINSIYFDSQKIKLSDNQNYDNNPYNIYNKITEDYSYEISDYYNFKTNKSRKVIINFEKNNFGYDILINQDSIYVPSSLIDSNYTYYKVYDNYYSYIIDNVNYDNPYFLLNFIISFLALSIIIYCVIENIKRNNFIPNFIFLSLFLFEFNNLILINLFYKVLLFIFIFLCCFIIKKYDIKIIIHDRKKLFLNLFISFFTTFSFIGNLYLDKKIVLIDILIFISFIFWLLYIIQFINHFMPYIFKYFYKKNNINILDKIFLFLIPFIGFISYSFIFYPYIITTDGNMQMIDVLSRTLSNWHPYFSTLIMNIVYNIFNSFRPLIIIRILVTSFLISTVFTYFMKNGIRKSLIYILVVFISFNPITGVYMVSIIKDTTYVIFLLYLVFLIMKYTDNNFNFFDYILLYISLLFISLYRHNGIYVSFACVFMFLYFIFKRKDKGLIISCLTLIITIYLVNVSLYKKLNVKDGLENSDVVSFAHGLQYVITKKDDKDIDDFFSGVISLNELKDSYNKTNIDVLLHYVSVPFRNVDIKKTDLIKLYINKFFKYPYLIITDRLYGTDILWNVFKSDNIQNYNYQIKENEFGIDSYDYHHIDFNDNFFKNAICNILLYFSCNKILDALFFRVSIYISLIIFFFINYGKKKNIFSLFPIIINILTFILVLHHQSYRYVMFIPLIFILYFLRIIIDNNQEYE